MASFFFSGSFQFNQESEQTKWNQKERNENKIEKKKSANEEYFVVIL